ncbi:MAG: HDOD domain-containing protein [bacterium]|nr:HDOD domain-containing protein [bacterium]
MPAPGDHTDGRLHSLLTRAGSGSDFPAHAQIIRQIHAAVQKDNCAALDVVRIILKDPGLSSKVLRVVNSAYYRHQTEPISTVTRAVIILGFETIRDVTTGLLLLEDLVKRGQTSEYIREGLRRSLYCGLLAQALSAKVGYPMPEEAYLLGLFADWGMLWVATHFPDDFEKAQRLARRRGLRIEDAATEVLGVPPTALAAGVLEKWRFPPAFAEYFRETPSERERLATRSDEGRLLAIVNLASDFTAPQGEMGAEVGASVLKRFQNLFGLAPEPFLDAARSARDAFRHQAPLFGLEPDDPAASPSDVPADAPAANLQAALSIISEITRAIVEHDDINETLAMVLEGVARAGRWDVVFFALLNAGRDRLVGRLGYGEDVKRWLAALDVPLRPDAGVLAECVLGSKPCLGSGTPTPALSAVTSFLALPLVVRGRAIGVLVAGRTQPPAASTADMHLVQLFCSQASLALDRAAN